MDPITQGVLGATLPQSTLKQQHIVPAAILGALGGMAPDLDVFIRSSSDPLLFLEYHRQFTHALAFIPIGGLICAAVLHPLIGRRFGLLFWQSLLMCTLGYATHALLDACTTYGTMLFWPFSDARIAWNTVSVVDPLVTLPALALVIMAARKQRRWLARLALAWVVAYLCLGWMQRDRAQAVGWQIATERGHTPIRLEAKPSMGNIIVWKIVYETTDKYYVDAVRVGATPTVYPGQSIGKLDWQRDLAWLPNNTQQALDVERFRWFSNGYIARDPANPLRVIDIRYSIVPNELAPLWSIELSPGADNLSHAKYLTHRDSNRERLQRFSEMLFGNR